jgi:hypothetical protein
MCKSQGTSSSSGTVQQPLDYPQQAAVAEAINQLQNKDHVRGVLRIMEESGYTDIKEIHVHTLTPALQRELCDFIKSTGAKL